MFIAHSSCASRGETSSPGCFYVLIHVEELGCALERRGRGGVYSSVAASSDRRRYGRSSSANSRPRLRNYRQVPVEPLAGKVVIDTAETLRFQALRLHEVGMIKSTPKTILSDG